MKSKPRAKTDAGLAVISEEAPRKFMDHGWVTVNYNVARCSLIIVPVVACRCHKKKTSNQIYLPKGRFSARSKKKNDFTRLPEVCKSRFTGARAQGLDPCSINN